MPNSFQQALRGMASPPFLQTVKFQELGWRANREGAHPDILEFERRFIKRMTGLGVPVYGHCVIRTADLQQELFETGKSKDSPADGLWPHKCGAVDIVHATRHWNLAEPEWDLMGHMGKEVAQQAGIHMVWGGDWKFYDPAHWELEHWRELAQGYPWAAVPTRAWKPYRSKYA